MERTCSRIFWLSLCTFVIACGGDTTVRHVRRVENADAASLADASSRPDGGGPPGVTVALAGGGSGTVSSSPAGIDCGAACSKSFSGAAPVVLTATPSPGSRFAGWEGACTGTAPTCTVPGAEAANVTARFELETSEVTLVRSGAGSGDVTSSGGEVACGDGPDAGACAAELPFGTEVTLTATPKPGSVFIGWSGPCTGKATCRFTVTADVSVVAEFGLASFSLAATRSGDGDGSISADTGGLACPTACSATYTPGATVTLTATPADSSTFVGWTGACSGASTTCVVTVDAAKSVNAEFALKVFDLTASTSGAGTGTVAVAPSPTACDGGGCPLKYGTSVTIQATPGVGSQFLGWSGDGCSGTDPTCVLVMDAPHDVVAVFSLDSLGVSLVKTGTGTGTLTSAPVGLSCGSSCTAAFPFDASVVITATAAVGSQFVSFAGCDSVATNKCTVTVDKARQVSARFDLLQYAVTVAKAGTGTGTVTADSGPINCGATCLGSYGYGTSVVLTATASTGSTFASWANCPAAAGTTCTVDVTAASSITATFTLNKYTLTAAKTGVGTVTSSPAGISCGVTCGAPYSYGTVVKLTAAPGVGYKWGTFTNCPSASVNVCTVTVTAARTVTANFAVDSPPTVTITSPATGSDFGTSMIDAAGYYYADIPFTATATDPEDGPLTGASLVWTTNLTSVQPAMLGTGTAPVLHLDAVCNATTIHTITVTAKDSAGNVSTASIMVQVDSSC